MRDDELQRLWHAGGVPDQKEDETMLSQAIEQARARGRSLRRNVARRNTLEYLGCAVVAVYCGYTAWGAGETLTRIGFAWIAASAIWIAFWLTRYGGTPPDDRELALAEYRQQVLENLRRQERLLRTVKYWYLAPMYTGLLLTLAGKWRQFTAQGLSPAPLLGSLGLVTAVFGLIWALNEIYGVRAVKRELAFWRETEEA
jgi:cytochrome c biogenesis protein CcdA